MILQVIKPKPELNPQVSQRYYCPILGGFFFYVLPYSILGMGVIFLYVWIFR
jgi:hypothetical protein